jgi:tripeptide aminopeptidase
MICAHMDTVPPLAPIEPVRVDDGWENANDGILGADNKATVAMMIELARRLKARPGPVGVELLFTVSEEPGLWGAKAFDVSALESPFGFAFDQATPLGEIVMASPTYSRIEVEFRGRAAHAGVRPEDGRSAIHAAARGIAAMRIGRLDAETTANVGVIAGGSATNVVPERCRVEAEVRAIDAAHGEQVVTEVVDHLQDAANAGECDLDVTVQSMFTGYRLKPSAPEVQRAEHALRICGYEPRHIATGGGSDVNALLLKGFRCVCLADGTEHNHEPGERISVDALEGLLELGIALVEQSGVPE